VIREYSAPDALPTLRLFARAVREVARQDYTPEQVEAWVGGSRPVVEWNERRLATRTIVCTLDGELAGFSDVSEDGYIDMLFVDPVFTRRGVASELLESHLTTVPGDLWTNASITARGFFSRHGFVVEASQEVALRGQTLTNYRMRLVRDVA
jgi:putative acetyltransferase